MEMGSLTHFSSQNKQEMTEVKQSKIPDYAKEFKNEWLYIRGINKKCGEFSKMIDDSPTTEYEEVFWSYKPKALIRDFKNVLEAQKRGGLQNISKLKFKLSAVYKIVQLRLDLYYIIGNNLNADFIMSDDEFQDFFETLIIFTNNTNIKKEDDFEDDLFDINDFKGTFTENLSDFDTDTDSDIDSESD